MTIKNLLFFQFTSNFFRFFKTSKKEDKILFGFSVCSVTGENLSNLILTHIFKSFSGQVIDNLLERQETSKSKNRVDLLLKIYQRKMMPRFTMQLVISDSAFRKVSHHDISQRTAIHSYSSATIGDIFNVVYCCSSGAKEET